MADQQALKIGWCGPIERAADMQAAGLDYIEVQIVPLKLEDDAAFAEARAHVRDLPLPALAMSYLFPHDFRLVGEQVDERRNRAYFDRVAELLRLAGARTVVLGSGWTRNVPEGGSRERTEAQFLAALSSCADTLRGSGTTLVIEPLNRKESNFVNSVTEGVDLAKKLGRPEVRGLADFYHMDEEQEPLSNLAANAGWVRHIHLADTGRLNPGTGRYDYPEFMRQLKASGYDGLLSGECGFQGEPVAAMRHSLAFLRSFGI
jgi:sugar phosphate isomerase/epimerase